MWENRRASSFRSTRSWADWNRTFYYTASWLTDSLRTSSCARISQVDPQCENCTKVVENMNHFLFKCSKHAKKRQEWFRRIKRKWNQFHPFRHANLEALLAVRGCWKSRLQSNHAWLTTSCSYGSRAWLVLDQRSLDTEVLALKTNNLNHFLVNRTKYRTRKRW